MYDVFGHLASGMPREENLADVKATVIDKIPELEFTRFNDVIGDPEGRVYRGAMTGENMPGRLHRYHFSGSGCLCSLEAS